VLRLTVDQLREAGVTSRIPLDQLDPWDALLRKPGQWFPGPAFIAAWGRKSEE
jgi:hypothetical protein